MRRETATISEIAQTAMIYISNTNNNSNTESNIDLKNNIQFYGDVNVKMEPDTLPTSPRYLSVKGERLLNAFASLLSSAQSFGLDEPLMPRPEPTLACLLSPLVKFNRGNPYSLHTCSFPSLSLTNSITDELKDQSQKLNMQELAALNLAFPCFVDPSDAEMTPVTMLENFSNSFMTLIKSRLRTSLGALFGGKSSINSNESMLLMKLLTGGLSCSSPASLTTAVTSFRTLPMTENMDDPTIIYLPLVFEATIDITVLGKLVTVRVSAPGTITGVINQEDELLERVEVLFDTIALLQAMMKQARYIVRKAIARAAGIAHQMTSSSSKSSVSRNKLNKVFDFNALQPQDCFSGVVPDKTVSGPCITNHKPSLSNNFAPDMNYAGLNNPSKNVKSEAPANDDVTGYKMFSWLAGDKMLLDNDEQNLYTTNGAKRNSLFSKNNDFSCNGLTEHDKPMKKRKVSFSIQKN